MIYLKKKKFQQNLRGTTRQNVDLIWRVKNSKFPFCFTTTTESEKHFKVLTVVTFRSFRFSKYCLRSKKNESQNELFSVPENNSFPIKPSALGPLPGSPVGGKWKKSVATLYYLLIAYKKTVRIKFQYYFNNLTLLKFGLALSPFIAYLIQISLEKYELQYQKNTFLHRSLPAFVKPIPKITWDTFAYTKYSTKLDTSLINKVTCVDDCFFISLNPTWQLKQKQFLTGTFEIPGGPCDHIGKNSAVSLKTWSFLPSRYFYQLLSESDKVNWNFSSPVKPVFNLQKVLEKNSRWQMFYNDLDDIPTKLNSIFPTIKKGPYGSFFQNPLTLAVTPPLCPFSLNQKEKVFDMAALQNKNDLNFTNSFSYSNKDQSSRLSFLTQSTQSTKKRSIKNLNHWARFINGLELSQKISFSDFSNSESLPEVQPWVLGASLGTKQKLFDDLKKGSSELSLLSSTKGIEESKLFDPCFFPQEKSFQFFITKKLFSCGKKHGEAPTVFSPQKSEKDDTLKTKTKNVSSFTIRFIKQKLLLKPRFFPWEKANPFPESPGSGRSSRAFPFATEGEKASLKLGSEDAKSLMKGKVFAKGVQLFPGGNQFSSTGPISDTLTALNITDWIGLIGNQGLKRTPNSSSGEHAQGAVRDESLIQRGNKTWITLLTETLNQEMLKARDPLFCERNFQYNMFFGFSKFSKILHLHSLPLKKAVAFKLSEKLESTLRNQLEHDLTIPLTLLKKEVEPFFIKQTLPLFPLTQNLTPAFSLQEKVNALGVNLTLEDEQFMAYEYHSKGKDWEQGEAQTIPFISPMQIPSETKKSGTQFNKIKVNPSSNQKLTKTCEQILPFQELGEPPSQSKTAMSSNPVKIAQFTGNHETKIFHDEQEPFLIQFSSFENVLSRVEKTEMLKNYPNQSFVNQTQIALKNPDVLLAFFKKIVDPVLIPSPFGGGGKIVPLFSYGEKQNHKVCNFQQNEMFLNPLLQRKISGYLHPDTSRKIILTNTRLFNVNFQNPKKLLKLNPSSFSSYNEKFLTLLLPQKPLGCQNFDSKQINKPLPYSLIQLDQPLSQNLLNSQPDFAVETEKESLLLFSTLQKKTDPLTFIEPDKAFTVKKESFFGMPIRSPYGAKLEDYRSQHNKGSKKKNLEKHFLARYDDSLNFLLQSNSILLKEKGATPISSESAALTPSFNLQTNQLESNSETLPAFFSSGTQNFSLQKPQRGPLTKVPVKSVGQGLTKQDLLAEITKASTFSNVVLEKNLTFSPFNSPSFLAKKENFFDLEQQPVSYQTPFQYTKSRNVRLFSPRVWAFQNQILEKSNNSLDLFTLARSLPLQGKAWAKWTNGLFNKEASVQDALNLSNQNSVVLSRSQTKQNLKLTRANKSPVLNVLYQHPNNFFKTWSILSQLGFIFIVAKLTQILQKEYIDEFLYYIAEFYAFLNEYDKSNLQIFLQGDNYRVIKNSKKKFSDLVGGRFLLTEFGDAILLLRNSRKSFYKIQINKPSLVTFIYLEKFYTKFQSTKPTSCLTGKKPLGDSNLQHVETFEKKFLAQHIKKVVVFLRNRNNVHLKQSFKGAEAFQFHFFKDTIFKLQAQFSANKTKQQAFVENAGFKFENLIPKGILLVGPPGCGKTLFVQALAGEASVPVIVESGQMLNTNIETNGTERLQDLFKAAREMSPCILFFDEIDTIGQKREKVLSSFTTNEKENKIPNTLNRIYLQNGLLAKQQELSLFLTKTEWNQSVLNPLLQFKITKQGSPLKEQTELKTEITNQKISSEKQQNQNLVILTQLLCELDGLTSKQEIIVIGATNRPSTLDPALTRPGRFGKVIYLGLPGKQKRFELLKFYSFSSGSSSTPSFDPLAPCFDSFSYLLGVNNENASNLANNRPNGVSLSTNRELTKLGEKKNQLIRTFPLNRKVWGQRIKKDHPSLNKIGVAENINWNYFANQTIGLSSAHISAAINRSALKAIFVFISNRQKPSFPFSFQRPTGKSNDPIIHFFGRSSKSGNRAFNWLKAFTPLTNIASERFRSKAKEMESQVPTKFQSHIVGSKLLVTALSKKRQIPKEIKLRVLIKSGSEFNAIFNQLICDYKKSQLSIEKSEIKNIGQNRAPVPNETAFAQGPQVFPLHRRFHSRALSGKSFWARACTYSSSSFATKGEKLGSLSNQVAKLGFPFQSLSSRKFNPPMVQNFCNRLGSNLDLILHNQTVPNGKKQPLHTFETIEYGIQTISTMNTGYQSHLSKGKKTNNQILGPVLAEDCFFEIQNVNSAKFFESKENRVQTKWSLKRTVFYKKHREYFRTLALLGGQSEIFGSLTLEPVKTQQVKSLLIQIIKRISLVCIKTKSCKKITRRDKFFAQIKNLFLTALTFFELTILNKYLNRITKNHSFGFIFLFNSTCLIKNSLFVFSIQNTTHKNLNFLYYNLIFFKASNKKLTCNLLLQWQNWNFLSQNHLFGDSLFINRSAYYLSGKSLITSKNRIHKNIEQPIHLWSFVGSVQKRQKTNLEFKALLTKNQFSQFLVSLIAGKAGETLMLSAQLGSQKRNTSTIGISELKEFGLVSKLMIENYLFYSQKELTRKQININLVENSQQIHQKEELLFLKELATLFEISNNNSPSLQKDSLKPYDQFKSFDQPWWQFKAIPLVVSLNLNYKKWYRLFVYEEQQNLRNIEWVAPDKTFHTQLNISCLVSVAGVGLNLRKETDDYFVNRELVLKYIEFCQVNWNQLQLLESDSLSSYFLFQAFNKVFILLEKNLEFTDFLVYSLLCQETLHAFAISNYQQRFSRLGFFS